jgi:hypothetical protein
MTSFVLLRPKAWQCQSARAKKRETLDEAKRLMTRKA